MDNRNFCWRKPKELQLPSPFVRIIMEDALTGPNLSLSTPIVSSVIFPIIPEETIAAPIDEVSPIDTAYPVKCCQIRYSACGYCKICSQLPKGTDNIMARKLNFGLFILLLDFTDNSKPYGVIPFSSGVSLSTNIAPGRARITINIAIII